MLARNIEAAWPTRPDFKAGEPAFATDGGVAIGEIPTSFYPAFRSK